MKRINTNNILDAVANGIIVLAMSTAIFLPLIEMILNIFGLHLFNANSIF
jgi:hypothetical protein